MIFLARTHFLFTDTIGFFHSFFALRFVSFRFIQPFVYIFADFSALMPLDILFCSLYFVEHGEDRYLSNEMSEDKKGD